MIERERFEAWARRRWTHPEDFDQRIKAPSKYNNYEVQAAWEAWQERAAQPAPIEMSITTGALSEMFLSLDGRDKAQPGYEWRKGWNAAIRQAMDYAQPVPSVPDVDALAQFIREVDGSHQLGAGVLAECIAEWLKAAPEAKP